MEWTWAILKLMMKLSPAGRQPVNSSLSMIVCWLTQRRLGISRASRVIVQVPLLNQYCLMSRKTHRLTKEMKKIHKKSIYCTTSNHYRTLSHLVKQGKAPKFRLLISSKFNICLKCTIALTMVIGLKSRNLITKAMWKKLWCSLSRPQTTFLNQEQTLKTLKMMRMKIMV